MKAQHTPGPWENVIFDSHGRFSIQCPTGRIEENDYISSGEMHSNAALIASAPELLKALTELVCAPAFTGALFETDHESHRAWTLARAAIQKARGEQ